MTKTITIADLFPDDEGMILVAKDAVDGSPRHISEVVTGKACGCVCFGCGRRLMAKNGNAKSLVSHHFAHWSEDGRIDCTTSGETALHFAAKAVIEKHRRVTLPATATPGLDGKPVEVTPKRSIDLVDVRLETAAGELIPDIIATMPDGRRIFIEIANTHPCPPEKIAKLEAMGVEVLEITVRQYRTTHLSELDDIIIELAPREMLVCTERTAKAAKIAEARRLREEREKAEFERLVAVYREPPTATHRRAVELVEEMAEWDLDGHLEQDDTLPSAFIVPRRQWQAAVFFRLIATIYPATVSPIRMVNSFKERGWHKPDLVFVKTEVSRKIAAAHNGKFKSAYEEVLDYMRRLERADVVYEKAGKTFYMTPDFRKKMQATGEALQLADANRQVINGAYLAIDALVKPGGGRMPDFDNWLAQHAERHHLRVREFLIDEDLVYDTEESLKEIAQVIEKRAGGEWEDLPEDLMGLPMLDLVNQLMQAWEDARVADSDEWRAKIWHQS